MQYYALKIYDLANAICDFMGKNCLWLPRVCGSAAHSRKLWFSRDFCEKTLNFALVIAGGDGILCGLL